MGTTKKTKLDTRAMSRVHNMAEAFAKARTPHFLEAFLRDSGIGEVLFQDYLAKVEPEAHEPLNFETYIGHLVKDYDVLMGRVLALAYACGAMDVVEKKSLTKLYVPTAPKVQVEEPKQLILPGVLD